MCIPTPAESPAQILEGPTGYVNRKIRSVTNVQHISLKPKKITRDWNFLLTERIGGACTATLDSQSNILPNGQKYPCSIARQNLATIAEMQMHHTLDISAADKRKPQAGVNLLEA